MRDSTPKKMRANSPGGEVGGLEKGGKKQQKSRKNGAIRRPPRWVSPRGFSELLVRRSGERLGLKNHPDRLPWLLRSSSRHASCRPFLLDRLRRLLSRDDRGSSTRSALLQCVDLRRIAIRWDNPELNSAVEIRIAGVVRTGIAEVANGYPSRIDALLVDEVVTCVVCASERYANSFRRIAMTINHQRSTRVLLHLQSYLNEASLMLVVDPRRIEREEDRAARRFLQYRRWRLVLHDRYARRAAAARTRLIAPRLGSAAIQRHCH